MSSPIPASGLRGVSEETNDAWQHFVRLFRRDCICQGPQISHDLLPARLEEVNEQLFAISHCPGGAEEQISLLISHPQADIAGDVAVVGSFHQVGLHRNSNDLGVKHCIKTELSEQEETTPYYSCANSSYGHDDEELVPNRKKSRGIESVIFNDGDLASSSPKRPKSITVARKEVLKTELLHHWKQFELREVHKLSNLEIGYEGNLVEYPSISFEQLLNRQVGIGNAKQEHGVSIDDAHAIVSFVTAVASPEALIQLKQALIGWRTQDLTKELMKAGGIGSVLKALDHLEAQNAFTAIATRIKLVQLAEAVDIANFSLPTPKGRGNPVVIWLSNQYRLFLRAEYPELQEGGKSWNTKLDDIKRKVRAGRRWQQLIKLFGVGVIGLVPSFAQGNSRNHDFNKTVKSFSDPCFKLLVETMEMRKRDHVKLLSAKLQKFMESLFKGNTDLPRLVLEYMDSSQIEAQPNCSPSLGLYLDIAVRALGLPAADAVMADDSICYSGSTSVRFALERLGLREEHMQEFKGNNKMSGAVLNVFMKMLQADADKKQDQSLFMDSDIFPGVNRCLSCRTQDVFCDVMEQQGAHCTRCRCDGVICEKQSGNSRLDSEQFYTHSSIYIPIFTKEITHWSLVVVRPFEKSVVHYDSLAYSGSERPAILTWALREVVKWTRDLISPARWESEEWKESAHEVAKQPPGGNDCGICTVMFCRLLLTGRPFPLDGSLSSEHMAKMRRDFASALVQQTFASADSVSTTL